MKTKNIITDEYKLPRFKKLLTERGFTDFKIITFIGILSIIKVNIDEARVDDITAISFEVERFYKEKRSQLNQATSLTN